MLSLRAWPSHDTLAAVVDGSMSRWVPATGSTTAVAEPETGRSGGRGCGTAGCSRYQRTFLGGTSAWLSPRGPTSPNPAASTGTLARPDCPVINDEAGR